MYKGSTVFKPTIYQQTNVFLSSLLALHPHSSIGVKKRIRKRNPPCCRLWKRATLCDGRLLAEAEGLVAAVEGNELRLEHGVAVDLETGALVTLDATEAGGVCLIDGGEGDLVTGDLGHVGVTDGNSHIGKLSAARVDVATDLSVELGALDLGVVGVGDVLVDEEERSSGVGNGLRGAGVLGDLAVDGELGRRELPEARGGVDGDPGHVADELGGVDLAELVDTGAIGVEIGSEDGHVQAAHHVVEEGLLGELLGSVVDCALLARSFASTVM